MVVCRSNTLLFEHSNRTVLSIPKFCKNWNCETCSSFKKKVLLQDLEIATSEHNMHYLLTLTDKTKDTGRIQQTFQEALKFLKTRLERDQLDEYIESQVEKEIYKINRMHSIITIAKSLRPRIVYTKLNREEKSLFLQIYEKEINGLTEYFRTQFSEQERDSKIEYWKQQIKEFAEGTSHYYGVEEKTENQHHIHYITNIPMLGTLLEEYLDDNNKIYDFQDIYLGKKDIDNNYIRTIVMNYAIKYVHKDSEKAKVYHSQHLFSFKKLKKSGLKFKENMSKKTLTIENFINLDHAKHWIDRYSIDYQILGENSRKFDLEHESLIRELEQEFTERVNTQSVDISHKYSRNRLMLSILNDEQTRIVRNILRSRETLYYVKGKAGTGKTEIIDHLRPDLVLCYTGSGVNNIKIKFPHLEAKTIHSFYKSDMKGFPQLHEMEDLDLIVIDEIGLVPPIILSNLLSYINKDCKIVFIGDEKQIKHESLDVISNYSNEYTLEHVHRHRFNIDVNDSYSVSKIKMEDLKKLKQGKDIILTNTRKLSQLINKHLENPDGKLFHVFRYAKDDPVMITQNNRKKGTFNGELCLVFQLYDDKIELIKYDGTIISYDREETNQLTLAHAITIHKAQGKEYRTGFIVIEDKKGSYLVNKNILYSARTRFKDVIPSVFTFNNPKRIIKKLSRN